MTSELKSVLGAMALIIVMALGTIGMFKWTSTNVSGDELLSLASTPGNYRQYRFFATSTAQNFFATTTTATSTNIIPWFNAEGKLDNGTFDITGADRVVLFFSRGDLRGNGNTGSSVFKVQVTASATPTESDWFDFKKLVQATSTSVSNAVVQQTATITTATTTLVYSMDLSTEAYRALRLIVTEATDGEHAATVSATW